MRGYPWHVPAGAGRWLLLATTGFFALTGAGTGQEAAQKHALLVGCTAYELGGIPELYGPGNDVYQFAEVLRSQFEFPAAQVAILADETQDARTRPTYANIKAGFEKLIAAAAPGAQVVILLAGHGVQVPIPAAQQDPLDPKNPEPDGMDEVFLPADVRGWENGKLDRALRDDQIAGWLKQMEDRGAAVWIIFDCCHSGTMMRAVAEPGQLPQENPRVVRPQALGIPDTAIDQAHLRAARAVQKAPPQGERLRSIGTTELIPLENLGGGKAGKGSVVAFYAAQAFETTPELPRPENAARVRKNYYGLFSYTLVSTLKQSSNRLTYRELGQAVIARYDAERGSRGPTPAFEGALTGDLNREVLGREVWKRPDILLRRKDGQLGVSAGELRGLTAGSVLAVHPPAGDKRGVKPTLGYLKVTAVTPTDAEVEPCPPPNDPEGAAVDAGRLPALARCTVAVRQFGDMRVTLAVHPATAKDTPTVAAVRQTLEKMSPEIRDLFRRVDNEAEAEWLLWVEAGKAHWRPGTGFRVALGEQPREAAQQVLDRSFGNYAVADDLGTRIERDLQTIFTWRNVWRVAGTLNESANMAYNLKLEVTRLKDNAPGTPLAQGTPLVPGDRLAFTLSNKGYDNLWVTLIWVDANFGIRVQTLPQLLRGGDTYGPLRGKIEDVGSGKEGLIVLALSQEVSRGQPDFGFLEQGGLKANTERSRGERTRGAEAAPDTPFGRLLRAAAIGQGTRAFVEDAPTNPAVLSWSWLTLRPVP